jgi:hypothetical protein
VGTFRECSFYRCPVELSGPLFGGGKLTDFTQLALEMHRIPMRTGGAMPLINIVIMLVVVGVVLWLINTYVPMAGSIKTILNVVVVIAVCVWILQAFGLWTYVTNYRAPRY